jgi:hypothetical protein
LNLDILSAVRVCPPTVVAFRPLCSASLSIVGFGPNRVLTAGGVFLVSRPLTDLWPAAVLTHSQAAVSVRSAAQLLARSSCRARRLLQLSMCD